MSLESFSVANDPCDCPPGKCAAFHGDDDRGGCVNRLAGDVRTDKCKNGCQGWTWHHNGECLRCKAKAEGRI